MTGRLFRSSSVMRLGAHDHLALLRVGELSLGDALPLEPKGWGSGLTHLRAGLMLMSDSGIPETIVGGK